MSHPQTAGGGLRALVHSVKFVNPTAVTLTMKKRFRGVTADDILASSNFAHFRRRLDQKVLGSAAKRYAKKIKIVAVLEKSADGRLHYHCIIERPSHWSFDRFAEAVYECWSKTDFGYHQVDIQDQADAGWTDCILKARQKQSLLDSIDWRNCSLTAE
jgi:pyridoxine/pyridoxamine 5'-phosphate oxidase